MKENYYFTQYNVLSKAFVLAIQNNDDIVEEQLAEILDGFWCNLDDDEQRKCINNREKI